MNQKYVNIILAALICVALGVATFGGKIQTIIEKVPKTFSGVTGYDTVELDNLALEASDGADRLVQDGFALQTAVGERSDSWQNTSGREVEVSLETLSLPSGNSASSSVRIYVFATTTASLSGLLGLGGETSFGATTGNATDGAWFMNNWTLATSTAGATTTTGVYKVAGQNVGGTGAPIMVANNSYVHLLTQVGIDCDGAGGCNTFSTSTDLGLTPLARFSTYSTTTAELGR